MVDQGKLSWDEEKKDFARQAFKESLDFMQKDNKIIGDFSVIIGALAQHLKDNPGDIMKLNNLADRSFDEKNFGDIKGAGFGDSLLSIIENIIVKDKEFILGLLSKLFDL